MYKYNIYTYTILEQSIEFSMNWAQSPSEDRICYRDTRAVIARYQFPLCRKKKHILNNTDSSTTLFLTNVFFVLTFISLFLFLFIVGVCLGRATASWHMYDKTSGSWFFPSNMRVTELNSCTRLCRLVPCALNQVLG